MHQSGWLVELARDSDTNRAAGPLVPLRATLAFLPGADGQAVPASFFGRASVGSDSLEASMVYQTAGGWDRAAVGSPQSEDGTSAYQADVAIDYAAGQAHIAYLRGGLGASTGTPVYNTFSLAQGGSFQLSSSEVVAAVSAIDVAVAVDVDGAPLVAYTTSANVFVFKRSVSGTWAPYSADGSHPGQPALGSSGAGSPSGLDMAVDGATGRVFVAATYGFVSNSGTSSEYSASNVGVFFADGGSPWALPNFLFSTVATPPGAAPPVAALAVSVALSPEGLPSVGATILETKDPAKRSVGVYLAFSAPTSSTYFVSALEDISGVQSVQSAHSTFARAFDTGMLARAHRDIHLHPFCRVQLGWAGRPCAGPQAGVRTRWRTVCCTRAQLCSAEL